MDHNTSAVRHFLSIALALGSLLPGSMLAQGGETEPAEAPAENPVTGRWEGEISIPGQPLKVIVSLENGDDGLQGAIDIPAQGARGLALEGFEHSGARLVFRISRIPGSPTFEGTLDGDRFAGTYRQGGATLPFELVRVGDVVATEPPARPQMPEPPFPYRSEDVRYPGATADVELAGTLTLPAGEAPFPAVVLASGSGPQDRDSTLFDHKPFLVLADHLTRAGIAVLRFDDRGHGESTGDVSQATSSDLADDVLAGVRWLAGRDEIDPRRIGIVGHSEGGILAPMAATRSRQVAFVVMLAGTGVPGLEVLMAQSEAIAVASGADPAMAALRSAALRKSLEKVLANPDVEAARHELIEEGRRQLATTKPEGETPSDEEMETVVAQVEAVTSPWYLHFLRYDPAEALRQVRVPVLALAGSLDRQVLAEQNLPPIEKALVEGGNTDATVIALDGLNHLFQHAETGSPAEYGTIEETLAPELLERVTGWILERFGNGSQPTQPGESATGGA